MNKQITVAEAAKLMNKSQQFVRIGIQRGLLPIGTAISMKGGRYTYYISPKKFAEFTGIEV